MTRRTMTGYWRVPEPADVRGGQHVGTARGVLVFDDALQLGVFTFSQRSQIKAVGEANALLDLAAETTPSRRRDPEEIWEALRLAKQHEAGHDADMDDATCQRCREALDSDGEPSAFCSSCIYLIADALAAALIHLTTQTKSPSVLDELLASLAAKPDAVEPATEIPQALVDALLSED